MTAREKWEVQRAKRIAEKQAEHEIEEANRKAEEWMFSRDNRTNDPPWERGDE